VDVLIDGRYRAAERLGAGLRGSRNQQIHLLSERHTLAEVEATPTGEVRISASGELVLTGVAPLVLGKRR
jgi:anaerobic ribonucleoside-triphosphate reductase activating protein